MQRKELGQFFTPAPVAQLLCALAGRIDYTTAIDPMCGIGEMLLAAHNSFGSSVDLYGVEIDESASEIARRRLSGLTNRTSVASGSAFDPATICGLTEGFDLVITNPPYVRYQTLSALGESELNSINRVRSGLCQIIDCIEHLTGEEKQGFGDLAKTYSGNSDLAIPSWLLCMALTRVGGTLAMVVPEAWLTRNYSNVVREALLRWFEIEFVVEDADATWFPDALVRTWLIVARRVTEGGSAKFWSDGSLTRVRLHTAASVDGSLVGGLLPSADNPELRFVTALRSGSPEFAPADHMLEVNSVPARYFRDQWRAKSHAAGVAKQPASLPPDLRSLVGDEASFGTLTELGIECGQGLRTGANDFFYVDAVEAEAGKTLVAASNAFGVEPFWVDDRFIAPVLRKQAELSDAVTVAPKDVRGRVFTLWNAFSADDLDSGRALGNRLPAAVSDLVAVAARTNLGTAEQPRFIPTLSAVRTNERWKEGRLATAWYHLPKFATRHQPALLLPRVNGRHPIARLVLEKLVVDANFSTVWLRDDSCVTPVGLLALLNSTWCIATMELTASVMGGGALKLEATHLKRLPIPTLDEHSLRELETIGHELAFGGWSLPDARRRIDSILAKPLGLTESGQQQLSALTSRMLSLRGG